MRAAVLTLLCLATAAARADSPYEGLCGTAIHEIVSPDDRPPLAPNRELARALGGKPIRLRRHARWDGDGPHDFRYRPRAAARCWLLAAVATNGSVELALGTQEKRSASGPRATVVSGCTDEPERPELVVHAERAATFTLALAPLD